MINVDILERIVTYASLTQDDVVLEVGAGLGFLTQLLSRKCKRVIAVEFDLDLIRILKEQLHGMPNVELIEGDILTASVPPFGKFVSTPPYSISSPLLFWLLKQKFDCAVLTFQTEFAKRLVASVGSKDYGRLTVNTYFRAKAELLDYMPKEMFYPQPEVDSVVVRLRPREPPFQIVDEETFLELVRTLFTQRNKKVRNAIIPFLLKYGVKRENVLEMVNSLPFHDKRVRGLAPEDFGILTKEIVRKPWYGLFKRSLNTKV